jgi:ATP-dependent DNA helicase RecG
VAGLPEPEFAVSEGFQTVIRLVQGGEEPSGKTSGLILEMIRQQPEITMPEMTEALGKSTPAIELQLAKLKTSGKVQRIGPAKVAAGRPTKAEMSGVGEHGIFMQTLVVTSFQGMREGRPKEVAKEHPHDITVALRGLAEKGLLVSEESGRSTFYYRPGHHPMGDGCLEPGVCSKSSSEHLPGSSEHLIASSEHLDTLREIAGPGSSTYQVRKRRQISGYLQIVSNIADVNLWK